MRRLTLLAIALLPTLALAQPANTPPANNQNRPPANTTPPPANDGQVQTTDEANRANVRGAVSSPLRDFNAVRTKIPEILLRAGQDPYARPRPNNCTAIIAEVRQLNEALGADLDEPPSSDERDLTERGRDLSIDALRSGVQSLIPMRSWIRKLSGAEQHDKEVLAAITAGQVRRAYLKGLGEMRGCLPPGTPRHLANPPPPPPPPQTGPRYPTR